MQSQRNSRPLHARRSQHAKRRMQERSIPDTLVEDVLLFGRLVHSRGARIFVVGRREVARAQHRGVDLRDCEGLHVVVSGLQDEIITTYRNHDFRSLRPRSRTRAGLPSMAPQGRAMRRSNLRERSMGA
jgi:hypothetical protein